ncbi:U-box domain-containing protein 11 [Prunus yedoensis var. nudiflora]|uniref:RING-type E3 ubiquitin transferase n=1 Tax=Prunus yedoensis var. nudiflora TaxID=2094558 RepID=A0A314XXU0_PRUYE|nr:U-box domain-containing protein 11 [Prunus yedoensis var. nudiflora]
MAGAVAGGEDRTSELLQLLNDVVVASKGCGGGAFKKDCTDLVRRIALLTHLFEEIRLFKGREFGPLDASTSSTNSSSRESWASDLVVALQAAKRLVLLATNFTSNSTPSVPVTHNDEASKKISFQFQCVTWKLEKALGDIPYDQFDISEEVEEQVELVRAQLRRAIERYGSCMNSRKMSFHGLSQSLVESGKWVYVENSAKVIANIPRSFSAESADEMTIHKTHSLSNSCEPPSLCSANEIQVDGQEDDIKKPDATAIPDDFICPISLELMRDPVIVATGQMISRWCTNNNIEQPTGLTNGKIKKSDGSFRDISGDIATIQALVRKLSSRSTEKRRAAATEIRSLSKRSNNRILLAEAGAIPVLVNLITTEDGLTRENANGSTRGKKDAATALFNLCIYQGNKGRAVRAGIVKPLLKMLTDSSNCMVDEALTIMSVLANHQEAKVTIVKAGTIPVLIDLLRRGLPRNKENATAILLALCKRDTESLACISRLGAIIPLTELTKSGTERAKRKASSLLEHLRKLQQL